ncbi:primosomal protein N', partial [Dysgonomonas sp. OttesenSCG-928-M03]|nr:primosomal protein N' [Dysgonomonas sp. OttesenSCG-928-M03]
VLRHKDDSVVDSMAYEFSQALKQSFHDRVLGPTKPAVSRIQSLYIRKIVLKIENQASPQKVREVIDSYQKYLQSNPKFKSVLLHYDVDPM